MTYDIKRYIIFDIYKMICHTICIWYDVLYVHNMKWYMSYDIYIYMMYVMWYVMIWFMWNEMTWHDMIRYDMTPYMIWYKICPTPSQIQTLWWQCHPKATLTNSTAVCHEILYFSSRSGVIDSRQEIVSSFSQAVTVPQGSTTCKQQKFQTSLQYQGNNHG